MNNEKKEECKHKNKAYSSTSFSNNSGTTSPWICKDCGFEGDDFSPHYFNNEYEMTRLKFNKLGDTTKSNLTHYSL